jgi:molecular chaperone DnaK
MSNHLLFECQRIKEELSNAETSSLELVDRDANIHIQAGYTRGTFEELLDRHTFYLNLNQLIRSALNLALERGYSDQDIQAVLMVGGSSQIPSVQRSFDQLFGKERVMYNRPLDAVARGAAAFVAGVDFYDHIQHDYAIRYVDTNKRQYDYKILVKRGTAYPTSEPIARLTIKASHQGQQQLGIAIFEMSEKIQSNQAVVELVFDPSGAARITQVTPHDLETRHLFWMNEQSPTFLVTPKPAAQSEPCFDVEFNIDYNKRLTITARDLSSGQLVLQGHPVVRLI